MDEVSRKKRMEQLKARLDIRESKQREANKKRIIRAKFIIGTAIMDEVLTNPDFQKQLISILEKRVSKVTDKEEILDYLKNQKTRTL